jgi:hypothetical protein
MSFHGQFASLIAADPSVACPALEVTLNVAGWNEGVQLNVSDSAVSARGKSYDVRVVDGGWGSFTKAFDVQASGLSGLSTNVTLADPDGKVRAALLAGEQRNSPAVLYRVIPGSTLDYATCFTGLLDSWEYLPGQVQLNLQTDERALRSFWPAWPYLQGEWFSMDPEFVGELSALLYGKHDSTGLSGKGMLPTVPVWIGANAWYAVHLGPGDLVKDVYVADVKKTETTHYNKIYGSYAGGKIWTIVEFVPGSFPAEGEIVTVDAYGYAAVNDGIYNGAAVLTNPVKQIRHFLVNFAVNRSKGYNPGSWATAASIIDGPSWNIAAAYADSLGLEGSRFIGGSPRRVLDILQEWLESFPMFKAHWTADGKIALRICSLRWPGYWNSTKPLLRPENEFENSFRYESDTADLTRKISAQFLYDEVQQTFLRNLAVQDLSVDVLSDSTVDMYWSPARQV